MTRGQKSYYIYCTDKNSIRLFKEKIKSKKRNYTFN